MLKKIFLILIITFSLFFVCTENVSSDEEDFNFIGTSFEYYNSGHSIVYPRLIVHCEFSDDIPHKYRPYEWDPYTYESYEQVLLNTPGMTGDLSGSFGKNIFKFDLETSSPSIGMYTVNVIENSTNVLYEKMFNLTKSYSVELTSAEWIISNPDGSWYYNNRIENNQMKIVKGIRANIRLKNTGDIPFSVGCQGQINLPIEYTVDIHKENSTEVEYQQEKKQMERISGLFQDQSYSEKCYFKPGETLNYTEDLTDLFDTLSSDEDSYFSISGKVFFDDISYGFSENKVLIVGSPDKESGGVPGFELILFVFAAIILVFFRIKR